MGVLDGRSTGEGVDLASLTGGDVERLRKMRRRGRDRVVPPPERPFLQNGCAIHLHPSLRSSNTISTHRRTPRRPLFVNRREPSSSLHRSGSRGGRSLLVSVVRPRPVLLGQTLPASVRVVVVRDWCVGGEGPPPRVGRGSAVGGSRRWTRGCERLSLLRVGREGRLVDRHRRRHRRRVLRSVVSRLLVVRPVGKVERRLRVAPGQLLSTVEPGSVCLLLDGVGSRVGEPPLIDRFSRIRSPVCSSSSSSIEGPFVRLCLREGVNRAR